MNSIIQLRVPARLRRSLFRAADEAGLTLNAYITRLLAAAITEKEHDTNRGTTSDNRRSQGHE